LLKIQNLPEVYSYGIASFEDGYIPFGNNFNYNIGVGIRYTIPYWGGNSYKTEMIQRDYRIEQLRDEKNQILLDIKKEIDLTLNSIVDLQSEITNNRKLLNWHLKPLIMLLCNTSRGRGVLLMCSMLKQY